ncbi:hypothetical protein ACFQV2_27820 [Actinokineospora soli]|uniref:Branched-chain amino acid aminotransferase/4-amino-4-deoxychorismate lyase n=1 Tax=Actinokineospora soli TaxID=1048753 RepID=A0ABW2TV82_9PSEU
MSAATVNYGHYTAMVVARGRVRGLARHLERLDRDAWVVFGRGCPRRTCGRPCGRRSGTTRGRWPRRSP